MAIASVILPAHNEENAIEQVIQSIRALGLDFEIIVVDDGSSDRTAEIAAATGVILVKHVLRQGAGKSVKDGIMRATSPRIVMMDADCTYPAEKIPELLSKLDEGFELVVGARRGKQYFSSPVKIAARIVFRFIAEFATGKNIPDINSGMRAFYRDQMKEYFQHLCNGFSLPTTMTLAYFFTGRMVAYVPIAYNKRVGKSKVRILLDSVRTMQYIVESIAFFNPVKLFLLIALLTIAFAIVCSLLFAQAWIFFMGFFTSAIVFSLGLLAYGRKRY